MPALFVLYETAAGYSLVEVIGLDELGQSSDAVPQSTLDLTRFGKVVKLQAFAPFKNAAHALDEMNAISEAVLTDDLQNFLEANLPKVQISCIYCYPCSSVVATFNLECCVHAISFWHAYYL